MNATGSTVGNATRSEDGKGKRSTRRGRETSQLSGAFEHTGAILDPTRVSPYRPAADEVPHPMRPDTRQRLTARTNHPKDRCAVRPSLRSEPSTSRTVNRGCQAATRLLHFVAALRVTAAADRAESPCGPAERLALVQREQARDLGAPLRCRGQPLRQPRRTDVQNAEPQKKGLQSKRRPHTTPGTRACAVAGTVRRPSADLHDPRGPEALPAHRPAPVDDKTTGSLELLRAKAAASRFPWHGR